MPLKLGVTLSSQSDDGSAKFWLSKMNLKQADGSREMVARRPFSHKLTDWMLGRRGRKVLGFSALMVLPFMVILVEMSSWVGWVVMVYWSLISAVTFFFYRRDKKRAERGEWRVPELVLQGLALAGGWPGGVLAQWFLRHKTNKIIFQLVFWVIVGVHLFLSFWLLG